MASETHILLFLTSPQLIYILFVFILQFSLTIRDDWRESEKEFNSPSLLDHITLYDTDVIIFLIL